jgi:hypothetical protein
VRIARPLHAWSGSVGVAAAFDGEQKRPQVPQSRLFVVPSERQMEARRGTRVPAEMLAATLDDRREPVAPSRLYGASPSARVRWYGSRAHPTRSEA